MLTQETGHDSGTTAHRWGALACAPILVLFVSAAPAQADPILATHDGCVTTLPAVGATWTATRHFQFVASWDPIAGCAPTITHPMVLHEWFENFDGTGGLKVLTRFDWFPKCGRIQFDAQSYIDGASAILDDMGLVSLVFNTGVDCAGAVSRPAAVRVSDESLSSPIATEIPEPIWLLLFGTAGALLRFRAQRRERAASRKRD